MLIYFSLIVNKGAKELTVLAFVVIYMCKITTMKRDHVFQPGTPEALFEKAAVSLLPYSDYTVASNDIRVCLKAVTDDTPKLHIATVELAILGVEYSRRVEAGSGIVSLQLMELEES